MNLNKRQPSQLRRFKFAGRGLLYVIRREVSFRWQLLAALVAIIAGGLFHFKVWQWLVLWSVCGLVLVAELFNTAIERLLDLLAPDFKEPVGRIKDILAGAVLLVAILAVIVGIYLVYSLDQ